MEEIITQCAEFLKKSCNRYGNTLTRAVEDLRLYSGDFWTQDNINAYRPGKQRVNLSVNNWNVMCNAIASPFSASPYHVELDNRVEYKDVQELIDTVEADSDNKTVLMDAFRKAVLTGYGFVVVTTEVDKFSGEPKIILETVKNLTGVAMDPTCVTVDGSDAEEGAIVNYISIRKAKRLYGEDVLPLGYPSNKGIMNLTGLNQWNIPPDSVAVISYYVKEEDHVKYYKICCDTVVQEEVLPISYIPIIRLAGNEIFENNEINYNGIVQQTLDLELGANIAYSTLIERCGRSSKANYLIHVDAINGLQQYYAEADQDDSMCVLWKGDHQPVPLTEAYQTGDLQATIQSCRTLMEDVMGIPLTGITDRRDQTATEILRQEAAKESNTANYYNNAYSACKTIGSILIELINGGQDLKFSLENGPHVITRQMKARQELTALSTIIPDNMKPIIAKYFADTLKDDISEELSKNIVANLPADVKFISDIQDPAAIHQLNQMKVTLDQTMEELENSNAVINELKEKLRTAEISLMENREQRALDFEKFKIAEQNKVNIELLKLQQNQGEIDNKNVIDEAKVQNDMAKTEIEAKKVYNEQVKNTNELMEKVYGI